MARSAASAAAFSCSSTRLDLYNGCSFQNTDRSPRTATAVPHQ
jgi:hypothetical protein